MGNVTVPCGGLRPMGKQTRRAKRVPREWGTGYPIEGVCFNYAQVRRVAERFREPRSENWILLDCRHGTTALQDFLGENAEPRTYLEDCRAAILSNAGKTRVYNGLERVAVNEEVLPKHPVRVEAVLDAPRLYLARTRKVHRILSKTLI